MNETRALYDIFLALYAELHRPRVHSCTSSVRHLLRVCTSNDAELCIHAGLRQVYQSNKTCLSSRVSGGVGSREVQCFSWSHPPNNQHPSALRWSTSTLQCLHFENTYRVARHPHSDVVNSSNLPRPSYRDCWLVTNHEVIRC